MSDAVAEPMTDALWRVTRAPGQIVPERLALAIEQQVGAPMDVRTRLLVRDSVAALRHHWGDERFMAWLDRAPRGALIRCTWQSPDLTDEGFPSLKGRLMDPTRAETIHQFLRELSLRVTRPTRLLIGGSIALILTGTLERHTEDIDVVDEVPQEIREQHNLLDALAQRYGLRLTHFQSHFLPDGWDGRVRSIGTFGQISAFAVDPLDVLVGKLFSSRAKDRDDLRVLAPQFDRATITARLRDSARRLLADPSLWQAAADNWYVLFGDALPAT